MFKIVWLCEGKQHDIGGSPMFAPPPVPTIAGDYVVKHIWPSIHAKYPKVSGFKLVDLPSGLDTFLWAAKQKVGGGISLPALE